MSGGLVISKGPLPEGSVATLLARVVGSDDAVLTTADLYDAGGVHVNQPALMSWCINVYDVSSDTPTTNLFVDQQTITWEFASETGTFEDGEIVTMTTTYGTASGTVRDYVASTTMADGSMTIVKQTGDGLFEVLLNNTMTGATSGATVDFNTSTSPQSLYIVPRCGTTDDSGSDSGDEDVVSVYNTVPVVALTNDGKWDVDSTGYNFSFDLHPAYIEDTDEDGNTLVGWRGGHVYRVEFTLALGGSTLVGSQGTATDGGVLPVVFEFPVEPTTAESSL